jgi:acyl-coenzyme A thioesterase PaaI-like protein
VIADPEALQRILAEGFPLTDCSVYRVAEASAARLSLVRTVAAADLRPGGIVSGPVLMDLADSAAWLHCIARHGEAARASVTTDLTMHFLAPARARVRAECTHEGGTRGRERFTVHLREGETLVGLAHVGYAIRYEEAGA